MASDLEDVQKVIRMFGLDDRVLYEFGQLYTNFLMNYLKDNPSKKKQVIEALELLTNQIKNQP